jgi:hypothetical protein
MDLRKAKSPWGNQLGKKDSGLPFAGALVGRDLHRPLSDPGSAWSSVATVPDVINRAGIFQTEFSCHFLELVPEGAGRQQLCGSA